MTRRGARTALIVLLTLGFGASAPSLAAAAVTFGSTLPAPTAGYYDACTNPCTAAQVELPGAKPRSPLDGTIVRFRLRTAAGSDAQKLKFRVLRSSNGASFTGAGTSAAFDLPLAAGVTEFPVSMPVRTGDYIGIDLPSGAKQARIVARDADAFQAGWFPALADAGAARPSGNPRGSDPTRYDVLLQADVEPATTAPPPAPTPTPGPVLREPPNCATAAQVATCPDPRQPAVCGPTGLGFPQCSLPFSLPTACSGTGTAFPVCNLPGNHIVACGGLGLNLPVCNLPPLNVPQVCGPTTAGLPPCEAGNNQVLACGPSTVGLPACAFQTLIKAPKPIDVNSGELDLVIGCPSKAGGSAARAVAAKAPSTCAADVDLADLVSAKRGALQTMAGAFSWVYIKGQYPDPEFERFANDHREAAFHNYATFNVRARQLILDNLKSDLHSGYSGDPFKPLGTSAVFPIATLLSAQAPSYPGVSFGSYEGPTELWQNAATFKDGRRMAGAIVDAVNELYQVQERTKKKKKASGAALAGSAAARSTTRFHKRVKLRRGKRGTRIHIRLPRKAVRALRTRASRKSHAVAVRLVVSLKAKPRPIVRFVDFRIPVKKKTKRAKALSGPR
jgi:hypothetical protein